MPKDSYHHGDLRNSLIAAGTKVLKEEGLDALSLRRVAREAGVSAAAPYRHFKDKHSLLAAIAESGFKELFDMLENAKREKPGNVDHAGLAYLQFAQKQPEEYRLMFTNKLMCIEDLDQSLKDAGTDAFGSLVETIEIGMQHGLIIPTDSTELALAAWALVHGVAMLVIDGVLGNGPYGEMPPEEILKICQSYFRAGWKGMSE